MNLRTIREELVAFSGYLNTREAEEALFLYESQEHFLNNWDPDAEDPGQMFQTCFQNAQTRRLWKRERFRPLEAMELFWELDPAYVSNMFRDLFYESNAIDGRMGRFIFHADQILAMYKQARPTSNFNVHYHDRDYWMISLYLAFRYPDQYNLYQDTAFRAALHRYKAKPIPTTAGDPERYFKVSRTIWQFMNKEEGLLEAHRARLRPGVDYTGDSLLLVYEFFCRMADEPLVP